MKVQSLLLNTVENIVAKGEINRFEQFLLMSQCFQKPSAAEASEIVYMRVMVNHSIILSHLKAHSDVVAVM